VYEDAPTEASYRAIRRALSRFAMAHRAVIDCIVASDAAHDCRRIQQITQFELAITQPLVRSPSGFAVEPDR
jgi:hypothetical protein